MAQKKNRMDISALEAAQQIGVSERTIHRMLERGEIEGFRVTLRRGYRVYKDSLEKFLIDRIIRPDPAKK